MKFIDDIKNALRVDHTSSSRRRENSPKPGRVPYVPTWRPGDLVVPPTEHDKRIYRLGEGEHLVVVKQGPTFLLARNPRTDTMHHFSARQAKRLVTFTA